MGRCESSLVSAIGQTALRAGNSLPLKIIKFDTGWMTSCRFPASGALFEHILPGTDRQVRV